MSNDHEKDDLLKVAKPILFNTDMVRAILSGRKNVTRRVVKLKHSNTHHEMFTNKYGTRLIEIQDDVEGETFGKNDNGSTWHKLRWYIEPKAPFRKGDYLYVRETWNINNLFSENDKEFYVIYDYKAGGYSNATRISEEIYNKYEESMGYRMEWRPSIHMPKEAARIFLRVTDVWPERLQDIDDAQAKAEGANWKNGKNVGFEEKMRRSAVDRFAEIWNSIIKKTDADRYGWNANPWVWVIEFERVSADG